MLNVPVVMLVAAAVVLAGVIAVAIGRGGELAFFQADYAPLKLDEVSATDVVLFRPPMALWGYSAQATDEALNRIADALTERDIEITALRQQVANLEAASPAGRRRVYGIPGRPARPGPPAPPGEDLPSRPPGERPAGPLPRDERSSGPLPRVGPPPGSSGPGPRPSGSLPRDERSSGPLPRAGPPPGAPGPGARDVRTSGPHARVVPPAGGSVPRPRDLDQPPPPAEEADGW